MPRRGWIIAQKEMVEQSDMDDAKLNGCPEIANGIPPALQAILSEGQLPYAYEEPEPPKPEPVIDWQAEWDAAGPADKVKVLARKAGLKP